MLYMGHVGASFHPSRVAYIVAYILSREMTPGPPATPKGFRPNGHPLPLGEGGLIPTRSPEGRC